MKKSGDEISLNKMELRKVFLEKRNSLKPDYIKEASSKIIETIRTLKCFSYAAVLSSYYPFRNEVDLLSLLSKTNSKSLVFPKVVKDSKKLDFYRVNSINDFEKGVFGLMEPETSLQKTEIKDIALFLIPGVAFTKTGLRLGYGGGYYDETLKHKDASSIKVGVCFDIQITDVIPSEPWDIKMDFVITESRIIKISHDA